MDSKYDAICGITEENKQYAFPYLQDKRKLHKIGVNISSVTRTVDEWLEA